MACETASKVILVILTICLFLDAINTQLSSQNDPEDDFVFNAGSFEQQRMAAGGAKRRRYLLYEVNHSEGFNLRRDVYMRMANMVLKLRQLGDDWVLVLPPWGPLYHWKSKDLGPQMQIPWAHFFDLESLNRHVPVMEFHHYLDVRESIDFVYYLQYFKDTFEEGNKWVDKYEEGACIESPMYESDDNRQVRGWFWGFGDVYAKNFTCLSVQGQVSTIIPLLTSKNESSIMLDRAETVLHDTFGDKPYWRARRSMRFSKHLRFIGDEFRLKFLNSTDWSDGTTLPEDWRNEKPSKTRAKGGPYLGVHLRRQDFLRGRSENLPSLKKAAEKITSELRRLKLDRVYVATDAPKKEFNELESYLDDSTKCFRFHPSAEEKKQLKDGGVAIIDQWIVSHARHFIGSHESTFTFRVQEEREILGFPADVTFNRFCGDAEEPCEAPSRWNIVY